MSKDAADTEEQTYIYWTVRSSRHTVRGSCVDAAWEKAMKRHRVELLRNMAGRAWVLGANGKAVREKDCDMLPEEMSAWLAEMSAS